MLGILAAALVLGSFLINIKNIFTSCQVDAEYQVAMAYRIVRGDRMFSEMWEAHQTSAFFLAFFEWIFLRVTGSTTGIMVYANAVGILCKTAVAFSVWHVLQKYSNRQAAFAALLIALNAYPKDVVLPDFANLQIWFGLLVMCSLVCFLEEQPKNRSILLLIAVAISLCLQVFAYPSCVLLWIGCVLCLWRYSEHKGRDILIFTAVCAVCGGGYLLYFMRGDPGQFFQYVYYIWSGDESHAVGMDTRLSQFGADMLLLLSDLKYLGLVALGAAAAAWTGCKLTARQLDKGELFYRGFGWFMVFYVLGYLLVLPGEDAGTKYHFFLLYVVVEVAAWISARDLDKRERRIFVIGQIVGSCGFAATLILSDMGLFSSFSYLIPAICVSMIPLVHRMGKSAGLSGVTPVAFLCGVLLFRNAVYLNGWMEVPESFKEDSIFGTTWTAECGPLKGIRNGDGAYVADVTYREWQAEIPAGSKVLVISYPTLPATVYLNQDVEIAVDSTISTPTYSDRLLDYWRENPEKYPDVVVVRCYDGVPLAGSYNRVTKWLEEEFPIGRTEEGQFWRYYFAEEQAR